MELAVRTLCVGLNPQIIIQKQRTDIYARLLVPRRTCSSASVKFVGGKKFRRDGCKIPDRIQAISSDLDSLDNSVTTLDDVTVTASNTDDREIKIRVDVSGARTQTIFDDVLSKLTAAAQPIPGFRRVKGGKTPDVPKDVLLHILGPAKVYKNSIKKIINTTVAEYVEKENLKVTNNLRVEQSYEELESTFQPGNNFGFDAILQLQETRTAKC
ncbi:hypothetical protein Cni_G05196 [Canna indica]|uniref:peptidylprolyl isomerase n=1 Tax=Canna indica TaxID=4628 RepID=A0AAQ3Q586_9LILI|nr:hypothetical protein Cni_G05196 [Canna indica]